MARGAGCGGCDSDPAVVVAERLRQDGLGIGRDRATRGLVRH